MVCSYHSSELQGIQRYQQIHCCKVILYENTEQDKTKDLSFQKKNSQDLGTFFSLKFESVISIVAFFVTLARITQFTFPSIEDQSLCSNDVRNILWHLEHQSKKQTICCYTLGNEMAQTLRKLNFHLIQGDSRVDFASVFIILKEMCSRLIFRCVIVIGSPLKYTTQSPRI